MFPVIGIVLIIAVVFFVVRKRTHRVDVPLQVSETVSHFAPGVAIGSSVKQSTGKLAGVQWVPRVGYVGSLPEATAKYPGAPEVKGKLRVGWLVNQWKEIAATTSNQVFWDGTNN